MTLQLFANAILILLGVGWIVYRQLTWRPADVSRMMRTPAILGLIGLIMMSTTTKIRLLTPTDVAVLVIELVVSLGLGAIMGRIATFRPMSADAARDYQAAREERARSHNRPVSTTLVAFETRTGWLGLALWVVLIGIRIGIDALATMAGSELATSTAVILLVIAANRLGRVGVIGYRLSRMPALAH